MAKMHLGEGATRQNIKNFSILNKIASRTAKTKAFRRTINEAFRRTRKRNKSEVQADATIALADLYEDALVAVELFNNIYMPSAPDQETLDTYAASVQDIEDIKYKINEMATKFDTKAKVPKSKKINRLRAKLMEVFASVGLDYEDIQRAKDEKKFNVDVALSDLFGQSMKIKY